MTLIILGLVATAQGLLLTFTVPQNHAVLSPRFISELHFPIGGNNFAGTILRRGEPNIITPKSITLDEETIQCDKQFMGLYYNNQRGERLRPMDTITHNSLKELDDSYEHIQLSGGRYTNCIGGNIDPDSIVGQITFDHDGTQSYLIAGITPIYNQNNYQSPIANSFQRFDGVQPVGYIYDSHGGLGFVHGYTHDSTPTQLYSYTAVPYTEHQTTIQQISLGSGVKDIFSWSGRRIQGYNNAPILIFDSTTPPTQSPTIAIQGIIAATTSIPATQTDTLIEEYNSMAIATTTFTVADIFNKQRKRMYQQCQGRTQATSIEDDDTVLCINYPNYSPTQQFTINLASSSYADKTIFIKNADIHLYGTMEYTSAPLNVFIDNGNIVWHTDSVELIDFDNIGNPIAEPGVSQGLFLRGNFFIDGLFVPAGGSFSHKTYVHGKLISLHAPDTATIAKQNHIITKFGSGLEDYISLQEVFAWRCNIATNTATDGTSCSSLVDTYALAPLVVIDRYFPSILLQ